MESKWTWTLLSLCFLLCTFTRESSATLSIEQGRLSSLGLELFPIIGIATVELDGEPGSRPTYYFDCTTNRNNGSGIMWTRENGQIMFEVEDIPSGQPGKRLKTEDIVSGDLDVYLCSDMYSDDIASVNITSLNPAIMAESESLTVSVIEGLSVGIEVYVSGYPEPTESQLVWQYPNGSVISSSDRGVMFQDRGRRLVLSNVQLDQSGVYQCTVNVGASVSTRIRLDVFVSPVVITHPQPMVTAVEWSEVKLNCAFGGGNPVPQIRWEREGGAQLPVDAQISSSMTDNKTSSELTLGRVRYDDRGRYRCVADNGETIAVPSQYADIRVTPALRLEDESMLSISDLYVVEEESRVSLECFGTGRLEWTSSLGFEIPLNVSEEIYQSYDQTRDALALTIKNFTSQTNATYTCTTELTDSQNNPISVSVLITSTNPSVVIRSREQYVLSGTSTTLEARVFASPSDSATVRWYHRGTLIDDVNDNRYTASSEGDIHRLRVSSVSETETGEYTIVVSLNGVNSTDSISLNFPELPSATVTPSSISVNEGEEVRLVCEVTGSGPLTVSWTLSDGSPRPVEVQENGNELVIAAATSSHPGTYVCSVSNLAGSSQDEAIVTVYYSPTVVITYEDQTSLPHHSLYLAFDDGAPPPTIACSADANPSASVEWIQDNGKGLPHGITQRVLANGEAHLRWQRSMQFTDSARYICRASNRLGNSSATLEVLVQIEPTIDSIFAFTSDIQPQDSTHLTYTVPLNYVGSVLVCTANGWPAPEVEWLQNGQPIPSQSGVVSESSNAVSVTVSARLTWNRYFQNLDAGSYECVVRKPNTTVPVTSQTVQLVAGNSTSVQPPLTCSVQEQSVYFQIRVLSTSCRLWDDEQGLVIADEFHSDLLSVVRTECDCQVNGSDLEVLGSPQCSSKVEGAAVFHSHIETSSRVQTELIFCALFSWLQKSPRIRIDQQFREVDVSCPLQASSSPTLQSEECVVLSSSTVELTVVASVAGAAVLILAVLIMSLAIYCVASCCHNRKKRCATVHVDDHTYSRTERFSRSSINSTCTVSHDGSRRHTVASGYSTLTKGGIEIAPPRYPDSIALSNVQSDSSENLISPDGIDSPMPESSSRTVMAKTNGHAYEIPVRSQENLATIGLDRVGIFHATNRHTSSPSDASSSAVVSPVQMSTYPPRSGSLPNGGSSAANVPFPYNDYEDAFSQKSTSSFRESPTIPERVLRSGQPRRASEVTSSLQQTHRAGNSPRESPSPHTMKQALMTQFHSAEDVIHPHHHRESNISEAPPPYSSRRSSEAVLDPYPSHDGGSLSDNEAYEGVNFHQRPWYQADNVSIDSSMQQHNAPLTSVSTPNVNTTVERIRPYAMIHNEHIPYDPSNRKASGTSPSESNLHSTRRSSNQQQPKLRKSSNISSTLC